MSANSVSSTRLGREGAGRAGDSVVENQELSREDKCEAMLPGACKDHSLVHQT